MANGFGIATGDLVHTVMAEPSHELNK